MEYVQTVARATPAERRVPSSHPGPGIARDILAPLGLDAAALATLVGMEPIRFAAMIAGTAAFDVETAVRLGHSLGLPPYRIMRAQLRHDFSRLRATEHERPVLQPDTLAERPFPSDALRGHLARTSGAEIHDLLFFVADELAAPAHAELERVHALRVGDRLRVHEPDGRIAWAGPIVRNLDGEQLFPFAPRPVWETWFARSLRADYVPRVMAPA